VKRSRMSTMSASSSTASTRLRSQRHAVAQRAVDDERRRYGERERPGVFVADECGEHPEQIQGDFLWQYRS